MKIAMVSTFYKPTIGGVEKVIEELATRYVKLGHEVDVYCSDSDKYKRINKLFEVIEGVKVYRSRYWLKLSLNTYIFPGVILKLLKGKYDIIHSHVGAHDYVLWAGIVSKIKKVPHIHTTHCPWTDKFRPVTVRVPLFFTNLFLNKISFALCDKIIAITPWEIQILEKWVKKEKIVIIPNGMDKIFFQKVKQNKFKERYKIKGKIVLFFGRLHPTKAPDVLARVAKKVVKKREDLEFVFVGPDEGEMEKVKEIVKGEKRIQVLGPIFGKKNIAQMYQAAEVYVLPSYREGLPLTLFEAMASGLPIVATPVNGVPYEVKEGVNGLLVPYGDEEKLEKAIIKVVDDKKLANKLAKKNEEKAKNFSWDKIVEKTIKEYEKIIKINK